MTTSGPSEDIRCSRYESGSLTTVPEARPDVEEMGPSVRVGRDAGDSETVGRLVGVLVWGVTAGGEPQPAETRSSAAIAARVPAVRPIRALLRAVANTVRLVRHRLCRSWHSSSCWSCTPKDETTVLGRVLGGLSNRPRPSAGAELSRLPDPTDVARHVRDRDHQRWRRCVGSNPLAPNILPARRVRAGPLSCRFSTALLGCRPPSILRFRQIAGETPIQQT